MSRFILKESEYTIEREMPHHGRFQSIYKGNPSHRMIFVDDDFFVMPTIGQLIRGSLLVIPIRLARRAAATALGLSGLPESGAALDRAGRRASDLAFEEHLRSARALHRQRAATRQQ